MAPHCETPSGSVGLPDLNGRTMLRVQEVAALFDITAAHVISMIEEGSITAVDCASAVSRSARSTWRIPVSEVRRFAEQRSNMSGVGFRRATQKNAEIAPISPEGVSACPPRGVRALATPCNGNCNEATGGGDRP